jgi:hypothetical protein
MSGAPKSLVCISQSHSFQSLQSREWIGGLRLEAGGGCWNGVGKRWYLGWVVPRR